MVRTYSIAGYSRMIENSVRTDAYAKALQQSVKPGSVVIDIGAGTGIFSLLACRFGAKRVYAIEPDQAIGVARSIAADNQCESRIEFIQDISTRVNLSEKADVIVSDLRGVLPLLQHHIASIRDARDRLLVANGKLIPQQDTLWIAPVEAPEIYCRSVTPWNDNTLGFKLSAASRVLTNTWTKVRIKPEQLLAKACCWATLDYATITNPNVRGSATWTVSRPGTAHGFACWFDSTLAPGISISNSPDSPELIYGNAFFPWSSPVLLNSGDSLSVDIRADLVGNEYCWGWETKVFDCENPERIKASFKQSTFFGQEWSASKLAKLSGNYVPTLSEEGCHDLFILSQIDGKTASNEIAIRLSKRYPAVFPTFQSALTKVGDISSRYSRQGAK